MRAAGHRGGPRPQASKQRATAAGEGQAVFGRRPRDRGKEGGQKRLSSAAGAKTAAREAGHRGAMAHLGRRRRDRGEVGRPKMLSSAAGVETTAKAAGPPASRPRRRRRGYATHLRRRRRDHGEGGGAPRRILAAGVETAAREAGRGAYRPATAAGVKTAARKTGHRGTSRPPASRPRRGAKEAVFGRLRRDRGEGGGERGGARSPVSRPPRGQRCQRAEDFLDAKTQRSVSLKIQMLYYVKGSHIVYHMIFTGLIFVEINFQG